MNLSRVGIDLAKNVYQLHGVDCFGETTWKRRLQQLRGVGPLIATALIASVGSGEQYARGRQMAAALGLTPKQHSSGGKHRRLGISKRGDGYLRGLLIHGARSTLWHARHKQDRLSRWMNDLSARRHPNVAAVALANKTVRMAKANEYICPAGERLSYRYDSEEQGKTLHVYWTTRCSECALKADCTTGKERRIKRWEKEHILEAAAAELKKQPEAMRRRKEIVEHPYAATKHCMGATHFVMKRLPNVRAEMNFSCRCGLLNR